MPKDDGEFYQFCYITASGHVRGASMPFQFKHPMTDDLIEIEDENGELLVIRTKTAVLEDQLKKANESRAQLKQVIACYVCCKFMQCSYSGLEFKACLEMALNF